MPRTRWPLAIVFGLAIAVLVGVVVLAFAWPTASASAKNLPLVMTGPSAEVAQAKENLTSTTGVFTISIVDDRSEAVARVKDREAYGAIVIGDKPEVIVATAANASIATQLRTAAARMQVNLRQQVQAAMQAKGMDAATAAKAASTLTVKVTDVAPLVSTDKTGSGLTVAAFPLVMGGVLGGVMLSLLVVGPIRRLLALVVYAVAVGAVLALLLQNWFGFLQGDWLVNAAALSLAVAATAAFVVGCASAIGRPGIGVGAVLTMLIANPLSGASVPWQFYPEPWGAIGQWFVPGASSALLRDLSYFPDADVTRYWGTLIAWAAVGVVLTIVGHFRSQEPMHLPETELEHEGAHVVLAQP